MSGTDRLPLPEAEQLAAEVVGLIEPVCYRAVVAGSIRRRKADVGDVEIVCCARHDVAQADMFAAGEGLNVDLLSARCTELLEAGVFQHRLDKLGHAAFGPKYKRLLYRGFALDLFSPDEAAWGVVLTLRTGPAEFSRRLVTTRNKGGLLPNWLRVSEGRIRRGAVPLETPTEESVLEAIGLGWIEPAQRTGLERVRVASS